MAFTVVFDANVLFPISLCDLYITAAGKHLYRAHWSAKILEEVESAYLSKVPSADSVKIRRRIDLMNEADPGALIDTPPELIQAMTNDPKDRHVLATAVAAGADVLVTFNLKDFPESACAPYGIEAQHPDDFTEHLVDLDPSAIWECLTEMSARKRNPPVTPEQVRDYLKGKYLPKAMRLLSNLRPTKGSS